MHATYATSRVHNAGCPSLHRPSACPFRFKPIVTALHQAYSQWRAAATQLARSAVQDALEARHRAASHSDYQFTLRGFVVDATRAGGTARHINHSCDPNCVVRQVAVEGALRLAIFAARGVAAGEELCYDYKVRCACALAGLCRSSRTALACAYSVRACHCYLWHEADLALLVMLRTR